MRKIYPDSLCAETYKNDHYSGKGKFVVVVLIIIVCLFLGYLQRRQSKMVEETHHMQVMPKMLKLMHDRNCESVRTKKKKQETAFWCHLGARYQVRK